MPETRFQIPELRGVPEDGPASKDEGCSPDTQRKGQGQERYAPKLSLVLQENLMATSYLVMF